jgi:hypothetical protein
MDTTLLVIVLRNISHITLRQNSHFHLTSLTQVLHRRGSFLADHIEIPVDRSFNRM